MAHVVIAEDDDIMRGLLEEVVSILGWTFDSAVNGALALSIIERVNPDLVISDVGMPVMGGIGLLRAIKGNPTLAQTPVVLLSSTDQEPEAEAIGCEAIIAKPFTIDVLLQLLPQVLSARQADR